jgi:hypothetical protein
VLVVTLLAVLVILVIVTGLARWVWRARSSARVIDVPDGKQEALFHGGILCKNMTTSGTMVRLEIFDWGVRLRGIAPTRWVVPTWEARYDELALAELVASPFSRNAVWFRLRDEGGGMGFLSNFSTEILRRIEAHEIPVNRAVTKFKHVGELYGPPR